MAKVFLSYSRRDLEISQAVKQRLVAAGHDVFHDLDLAPGEQWQERIGAMLRAADVVMVLWSKTSVDSAFVKNEASYGSVSGRLLPVRIDDVELPLGFSQFQTPRLDLSSKDAELTWGFILEDIEVIAQSRSPAPAAKKVPPPPSPKTEAARQSESHVAPGTRYAPNRYASKIGVFIAHASADKPRLGGIVEALVGLGFKLWIDKPHHLTCSDAVKAKLSRIQMGSDWKESIREAVTAADKVIAFWSDDAIDAKREQFQYEVYQGLVQGKLFQSKLDPMPEDKIGYPYTFHQIADLSNYSAGVYHPELAYLMQDIVKAHLASRRWWQY